MKISKFREENPNKALRANEMEFFNKSVVYSHAMAAHTHVHDAIEIIYMNHGIVSVSIDGEKNVLYPGDVALFRSRAIHDIWTEDEIENDYFVLKILPKVLYNVIQNDNDSKISLRFLIYNSGLKTVWRKEELAGTDIELGLSRLVGSLDPSSKATALSRLISALMVLEGIFSYDKTAMDGISLSGGELYVALFYINEYYAEPISAEQIAKKINMSISSFSRSFKSVTGKSFKDYLNTVRTNRAQELLKNTEKSVKEVAIGCGYNNISHFISVYRKYKGKTPLEERKNKPI